MGTPGDLLGTKVTISCKLGSSEAHLEVPDCFGSAETVKGSQTITSDSAALTVANMIMY